MNTQQNDLFQRPASYWLRRAEHSKQNGDLIRAAVLERHAVRADRHSAAARMSYVLTLRQLHCYEASNREAFAALANDPSCMDLYGLIGMNLLSMGLRQEGVDALNTYLNEPLEAVMPSWHDDAYDLACLNDQPSTRKRRARLDGLLAIAASRLDKNDLPGAKRALQRAHRPPFHAPNARRELLMALYHHLDHQPQKALPHIRRALELNPHSAQNAASAACLLQGTGRRRMALAALWQAAFRARTPADELSVCIACDQLRSFTPAQAMLERSLRHQADRFPVCYNLCVILLRQGRLNEAAQHLHLCREIDPDDVQGELLFARVMRMQEFGLAPDQVRAASADAVYHGMLSQRDLNACAQPIVAALENGPVGFAEALRTDEGLRRRFLLVLSTPAEWPGKLLCVLGEHMSPAELEPLLREVLMQTPGDNPGKRFAAALLHSMGATPPYGVWQHGRIAWIDPTRPPVETPTFRSRILTLRIHQAAKRCPEDSGIIPWAMRMAHRLTPAQRRSLTVNLLGVWPLALNIVYRAQKGLAPLHIESRFLACLPLLRQVLGMLHSHL